MKITGISKLIFVLALSMFLAKTVWCQTVSSEDARPTRSCGSPLAIALQRYPKPASMPQDSVPSGCQLSFNRGLSYESNMLYAQSYDTLKAFVESCPKNAYAPGAFAMMADDVQHNGNGASPQCWLDFRQWLLGALAWNPGDPSYFCADVHAIGGTFSSPLDTSWTLENTATNKSMSVLYWLLHNPLCWNASDTGFYENGRGSQYEGWTNSGCGCPLDTTIYTMHDLGLDSVLKYASLLGVHDPGMADIISNATAYPNPTGEGTVLSFGMSKEAYVIVRLFDVLGHDVTVSGFGGVVEPGNLSIPVSLQGLPAGTYYARIQTTYGETQTVKLVKD